MINKNIWHSVANERAPIPKEKVSCFVSMFNEIIAYHGSIRAAVVAAGIGQSSYYKMVNHLKLSVCVAHRIADARTEMKVAQRAG